MTLWREYATPEELARYEELERATEASNKERARIRNTCTVRAHRKLKEQSGNLQTS